MWVLWSLPGNNPSLTFLISFLFCFLKNFVPKLLYLTTNLSKILHPNQDCHTSKAASLYLLYSYLYSTYICEAVFTKTRTMPVPPTPQQSDWNNNFYVVATTRIFVMIGMGYLIRSLYSLVPSIWASRFSSVAHNLVPSIWATHFSSVVAGEIALPQL